MHVTFHVWGNVGCSNEWHLDVGIHVSNMSCLYMFNDANFFSVFCFYTKICSW